MYFFKTHCLGECTYSKLISKLNTESTLSVLCRLTLVVHYQVKQQTKGTNTPVWGYRCSLLQERPCSDHAVRWLHASQPVFGTSKTISYAVWVSIEPSYTTKWNLGFWMVTITGSINKDFFYCHPASVFTLLTSCYLSCLVLVWWYSERRRAT